MLRLFQLCRSDTVSFKDQTSSESYTFANIEDYYGTNGDFYLKFVIKVVNKNTVPISDSSEIIIDSRRKFIAIATYIRIATTRLDGYS